MSFAEEHIIQTKQSQQSTTTVSFLVKTERDAPSAATWSATTRSPALATLTSAHVRSSLLAASRLIPTTTVLPLPARAGAGDAGGTVVVATSHGSPRRRAPSGTSSLMAAPPATNRSVGRWIDASAAGTGPPWLGARSLGLFALLASHGGEERGGENQRSGGILRASCSVCCCAAGVKRYSSTTTSPSRARTTCLKTQWRDY
jgi:hypothetical protein